MPSLPYSGVSMGPGLTAFTRTPASANSLAATRTSDRTAALVAAYTLEPGMPSWLFTELLNTIELPRRISGAKCLSVSQGATLFVRTTRSLHLKAAKRAL